MTIPKTFCPAKWDEILVNLSANYVYSCCKSTPIKITKKQDIEQALNQQRLNLLNGVQDPACNYCWNVENVGYKSLRYQYLENFNESTIHQYENNSVKLKQIEVSLGNECNFQCTYCNPKFSSQWESDVKIKPYTIFSDQYFYSINEKNKNNINDTISWIKKYKSIETLVIIGGEPLQNKNLFKVLNSIKSDRLGFITNLSCKKTKIDKIINLSSKYEKIQIGISIDSTGKNAEFSRYGMNFDQLLDNIQYLIANSPTNIEITFNSVMTSITIRDFNNTSELIDKFYKINPNIKWNLNFCQDPKILTLNTLPDEFKPKILEKISELENLDYINGLDLIKGAIISSKFSQTLFNQMKYFLEEFSARKNIIIPLDL